jgi:hypothetical protein
MATSRYVSAAAQTLPSWHDNPFIRFFLWASKTDLRLMRLCASSTRRTHVARGFFVTTTAIAAGAAAYYFILTTLNVVPVATLIGLLWGMSIFMFDRELVGGTTIQTAWARIALSFVLGMTISIPFELKLLENRLNLEIGRAHMAENSGALQRLNTRLGDLDSRKASFEAQLRGLREQQQEAIRNKEAEVVGRVIESQTTGIKGEGPAFRAADERIRALQAQVVDIENAEKTIDNDRNNVLSDFKQQELGAVYDFPTRYEALEKQVPMFSPLWRLAWQITIIIILYDMFPVLTKVLGKPTDYDALSRTQVTENLHRADKIAEHNWALIDSDFLNRQPSTVETFEELSGQSEE